MNVKTHDRIRTRIIVYYLGQVRKKIKEAQGSGIFFDIEQRVKLNGVKENKYRRQSREKKYSALIWYLWRRLEIQGDFFQKNTIFY